MEYIHSRDYSTSLILLSFLKQQGCKNEEFAKELESLGEELKLSRDVNSNHGDYGRDCYYDDDDGELQADGNFCPFSNLSGLARGMQADVRESLPMNAVDEAALRNVAVGLIEIADRLEQSVLTRASENLTRRLQNLSPEDWHNTLSYEVQDLMQRRLPTLCNLPQERVMLVLTMALVKQVCERVPTLLHSLFSTAVQYISAIRPRFT
ncbi:BH3 interacting domain death agonist [Amia ocellicauda]|uniref:BH3 interacting domain death agonist n=1 Tax=Amia ocellicauda TaxID=2972642 RepID=UPI003463B30A